MSDFVFPFQSESSIIDVFSDGYVNGSIFTLDMLNVKDFNCLSTNDFDQEDFESIDSIETMANLTIPDSNYLFECEFENTIRKDYFTILNWNIRSVNLHLDLFIDMFNEVNTCVDILGLCETLLDDNISNVFNLPNHTAFHQFRDRNGGGVSLFIKEELVPEPIMEYSFTKPSIEMVSATYMAKSKPTFIASIYRPPKSDVNEFFNHLEAILDYFRSQNFEHFYLLGDWNVNLLDQSNSMTT